MDSDRPGRIVVGVDGSEGADRALRYAVDEAERRGGTVDAVLVWALLDQPGVPEERPFDPAFGEAKARAYLDEAVARVVGDHPGVTVNPVVVCDLPARGLLEAAAGADLLVVGARGLGGFAGLLLGSVSQQVVNHAPCPVVVIPAAP